MRRKLARLLNENKDEDIIIKAIEKQISKIEYQNFQTIEPTIKTYCRMLKIVEDYIKINRNIVYGGTAIEKYLKIKNSYLTESKDPNKVIDYDFYSYNNERDSIAIANQLYKAGFKYSRRLQAKHEGTYRVSSEFTKEFVADITFIPKEIYEKLEYSEIEEILYLDPQFLKIDLYESITNPHRNVFRLEKSFNRLQELEKYYPITVHMIPTEQLKLNKEIKILQEYSKDMILTGITAFNFYTGNNFNSIYEFYSLNPMEDAKKLKIKNSSLVEHYQFLYFQNDYIELLVNSIPLARWYSFGTDCITIKEIDKQKVVNTYWLLRFFYAKNAIDIIYSNPNNYYPYFISELLKLKRQNLSVDCLSIESESDILDFKLDFLNRKKNRNIYKPEDNIIDPNTVENKYDNNLLSEIKK